MNKRRLLMLILALVIAALLAFDSATAMPPHPNLLDQWASQGRQEVIRGCPKLTVPGAPNGEYYGEPLRLQPGAPAVSANVLCVLIQFSDKPAQVTATFFDTLLFANQMGTVRHYYNEVSYNSFDIVTVNLPSSIGWQTAPQTYAYYTNGQHGLGTYPQNSQKLCEDIVDLIDPIVNYANYDNNGDGYVDGIVLVHTGPGAELTGNVNDIWSHKWGIVPRLRDGKYISTYSIQPEYWLNPGDMTLGVYAHELGHALFGLPDLYDVDYSSRGIGRWSLMSTGSWNGSLGNSPAHPDAWSRIECGFASVTNIVTNVSNQAIPAVETTSSGAVFRLWTNGAEGDEYFLIENRLRTGYDTGLPAQGLLIWHIDESKATANNTDNANEWYPGCIGCVGNYRVALEQADGLWQLEKNTNSGDSGDPFPGSTSNTNFTNATTPSSNSYGGQETLVSVTNISAAGAVMTADLGVSLSADVVDYTFDGVLPDQYDLAQNSPNPFNPSTRISFDLPKQGRVTLSVYNVLGKRVEQLLNDYLPAGSHSITWSARRNGTNLASGVYFYELRTEDVTLSRKMLLLK